MDVLFQNVWFRLIYLLFWAMYITVFWFILGPASKTARATTPGYALSVAWATSALVVVVPAPGVMRRVPREWFRVPTGERVIHRVLGVGVFSRLLDVSGWNRRVLKPMRGFSGKKTGLVHLEQGVQASTLCHGISFWHSRRVGCPRTFHEAPVEERSMDAIARYTDSSLPGAATALHHA